MASAQGDRAHSCTCHGDLPFLHTAGSWGAVGCMTSGKLVQDDAPLNLTASCIAGHPIYGTVLLSKIRLRPHEWNQPSVRWGSYTLALYEARIKFRRLSFCRHCQPYLH